MSRKSCARALLGMLPVIVAACPLPAAERPNIVFLMADDQCTYSMGCYQTPDVKTPNLDQLAADGIVFDNHYATTAICMASRASVMTGLFEYRHGCNFETGPLLREHWQRSYPVLLRQSGYRTAFAGKFGFLVAKRPDAKGSMPEDDFDSWGGSPGQSSYVTRQNKSMSQYADEYPHSTLSYAAFARDFIRESSLKKSPFCLSISFKAPHQPDTPDPEFDGVYAGATFTKPANFGRRYGEHFAPQSRLGRQYDRFDSWGYSSDYDGVMARYHQQIYAIDVAVGMIRQTLEETGTRENTVIIYTSDNGFLCGSHGYGSKVLPFEEASRVPLVMFDPRSANSGKNMRCESLTGNVDMMPTILSLAGVEVPSELDGASLTTLYKAPLATIHEALPLMNIWGPKPVHCLSVVTKDWKYIVWPYSERGFERVEEMYQTSTDPLELTNQAAAPSSKPALLALRSLY